MRSDDALLTPSGPEAGVDVRRRLQVGSGRGVLVAVVDSGWSRRDHDPRVRPALSLGGDDLGPDRDSNGHGTLCALRVLQAAPDAEILPLRVFGDHLETSVPAVCQAIFAAAEAGARIINLSLATRRLDGLLPLYRSCEDVRRTGVVVVAAAHNQGGRALPAHLEPVLSVAEGPHTDLLDFAFTPDRKIECTAAGKGVPLVLRDGTTAVRSGNSIAAATMSGVVARLLEGWDGGLDDVRALLTRMAVRPGPAHP